jgi:hypothetical protein
MAEDWEQYYSGFSPVAGAPVNTGTALQNTYYAPAATYSAPQGVYTPPAPAPQQALLPYQGSYSELRGWNPDPMAANNSGPALQGGSWGFDGGKGGLLSDAYQYPNGQPSASSSPSPYGDLSGARFSSPYGDLSGSNNFGGGEELGYRANPFGGDDGYTSPYGGPAMYQPQPTYASPAGGAQLNPQSPYGDLSGSQFAQFNPYGDLSGSQPSNPYGNLSGVPAMQPPSPYGNLANSQPQNPYGDLSGNYIDPMGGFQGSYQPAPPLPPARPASLDTGGAGLYGAPQPINTSPQNPPQSYQTPTTPATFGGLEPSFDAMSNRDAQSFDQTYMDTSNGPYGSLLGGNDGPTTYETTSGQSLGQPPQPIDTSYQNPQSPNVMPSSQDSAASASPMPASQQFASGMGSTFGTQMPSPDFGNLNLNFQPMPSTPDTKIADRAPQLGGFVSYSAPQLPPPATPTQPQGLQAITRALGEPDNRPRETGSGWMNLFGN